MDTSELKPGGVVKKRSFDQEQMDAAEILISISSSRERATATETETELTRQVSYSSTLGPGVNIQECHDKINQSRVKNIKFTYNGTKYEIDIDEFNKIRSQIISDAQVASPLFVNKELSSLTYSDIESNIYTWILVANVANVDKSIPPTLFANKVVSNQEIGTAHIDMFYRISQVLCIEPNRVYLSGEFQILGDTIQFNFSSGTYMLGKMIPATEPEKEHYKQEMANIFSNYTHKHVIYVDKPSSLISGKQEISDVGFELLTTIGVPYTKQEPTRRKVKVKKGGTRKRHRRNKKTKRHNKKSKRRNTKRQNKHTYRKK